MSYIGLDDDQVSRPFFVVQSFSQNDVTRQCARHPNCLIRQLRKREKVKARQLNHNNLG